MLKPLAPPVAPKIFLSFNPGAGTEDRELRVFKAIEYYYRITCTELGTPFDTNSARFNHSCETLTITSSNPETDEDNNYHFVWRDVGIQWYKQSNRNLKISRRMQETELVTMFNECVVAIDQRFGVATITKIEDTEHLPTVEELKVLIHKLNLSKSPHNHVPLNKSPSVQVSAVS